MNVTTRYLDGDYLKANPDWHEAESDWKAAQIARILGRNPGPLSSICEVGCGAGGVIEELSRHTQTQFVGYDVSPIAIDMASRKSAPTRTYVAGDAFTDPNTYDLAMAIDVFEHVEDYFGFLRKMKGLGRRQVYHIPLDLTVQALLIGNSMMKAREHSGHLHYFYKDSALATLRDTGHRIIDWFYTCGAIEVPGGGLKRRIAAGPRRLGYALAPDWAARVLGGFSMMVLCE